MKVFIGNILFVTMIVVTATTGGLIPTGAFAADFYETSGDYYGSWGTSDYTGSWGGSDYTGSWGSSDYAGSWGSDDYYGSWGSNDYIGSWGSNDSYYGSWGSDDYAGNWGSSDYTGSWGFNDYAGSWGSDDYYGSWGGDSYAGSWGSSDYSGNWGTVNYGFVPDSPSYGFVPDTVVTDTIVTDYYTPSYSFAGSSYSTYTPTYSFVDVSSYTPKYGFSSGSKGKYNVSYGFAGSGSGSNVNKNTNTVIVNNTNTGGQHTVNSGSIVPSCNIYANPSSVASGGSTTVTWSSSNATNATLSGVGSVATNGSYSISGLTSTRTFTLTVTGAGGSNTCTTTVGVYSNPTPTVQPSCTLSFSPSYLPYGGGATTLYWSTSNANGASIDQGIGSVTTAGGSRQIYPNYSKTYTMTVTGNYGTSATCTASVTVGNYQQPQPSNLWCTISAQPDIVTPNTGSAVLSWQSGGAASAELSGFGSVTTSGSRTVTPGYTRTYTLTVRDYAGNTQTCSTPVNVGGTGYYPGGHTGGNFISLTQVPYTGFDFGPVGNALYWLSLIALAGFGAYAVVFYRGGALNAFGFVPAAAGETRFLSEDVTENEDTDVSEKEIADNEPTGDSMNLSTDASGMPRLVLTRRNGTEDLPGIN